MRGGVFGLELVAPRFQSRRDNFAAVFRYHIPWVNVDRQIKYDREPVQYRQKSRYEFFSFHNTCSVF